MTTYNMRLSKHNKNLHNDWRHGYQNGHRVGIPPHIKQRQLAKAVKPCAS